MRRWSRWALKRTGRLMLIYASLLVAAWAGPSCGCPAASCRSTTRASSRPTCRRRRTPRPTRTLDAVEQVEKYLLRSGRRRERHLPHRLQLPRPGHQHGAGLHHAEGLVGARTEGFGRGDRRRHQPRSCARSRDAKISALQPPPIDNLGNSSGFSFRLQDRGAEGLCGADRPPKDQLIAEAECQPGAAEGLCRGPAAGAAGRSRDRPREGRRASASPSRTSTTRSRPISVRTTSTTFPIAAACSASIVQADRAEPHERGRHPHLQRARTATASWCRSPPSPRIAVGEGADPDRRLQLLSGGAHHAARRSPATPAATPSPRWSGSRTSCRAASATNGPASRCRRSCRARRRRSCSDLSVCRRVPVPCRAL